MRELDAKKYWVALNMVTGVGAVTFRKLLNAFADPQRVFAASRAELRALPGIPEKTVANILQFDLDALLPKELDAIASHHAQIVTIDDAAYPDILRHIFDPPHVLYVKGQPLQAHEIAIAVVGSRQASTYGRTVAEHFGQQLALKGVTVVSGLARGIDSAAHRGAIQAGGRTIAALGCGVDVIYPAENANLYHEITAQGSLISELPMGTMPDRRNFPARNRIISGLCLGTLVIEAGDQSGALITADMALEQGRDVFAVPGNITSGSSKGTNRLIKQGAALVEHADDILAAMNMEIQREMRRAAPTIPQAELPFTPAAAPSPTKTFAPLPPLSPEERQVFQAIGDQPAHIDDITMHAQLPSGAVSAALMMLEMKNLVRQLAGKMFQRR